MSNLFSRLSLRANIVTVAKACLLLVLVACGDGDSSLAPRDSDDSSSSICENSSSSRHCENCKDEAISSSRLAGKITMVQMATVRTLTVSLRSLLATEATMATSSMEVTTLTSGRPLSTIATTPTT